MSTSSLERHDLEQDISELRETIDTLESSRARLRDVLPAESAPPSGSIWSELSEIVTDFFELAGEAVRESTEDGEESDGVVGKAEKAAKRVVTADWTGALGAAFTRLRDRVASDIGIGGSAAPPVTELAGVLDQLDSEISRLNGDLQGKLDRVAELDRALDDTETVTPPRPHRRTVIDDDTPVIVVPHDDVVDVDVTPIPIDVLPDVDPGPVVVPDDVVPTPEVDVTPVVDVIPVVPDVVVPDTDDDTTTTVTDDDTPAYDPGNATEIGELDGAVYDVNEILANGHTVSDLRKYDVPAGVVLDAGVTASALLDGGYSVTELREAGIQAADLHGLASAADLRGAGYTAAEMHGVYDASECAAAFSPHELRDAGFSVSELHGVFSAADLRGSFSVAELLTVYGIAELHAAGFDAAELNAGGASWSELASAGFTISDLESAGAGEAALRDVFPHEFSHEDDTAQ